MVNRRQTADGFTLIEVILVIATLAIVAVGTIWSATGITDATKYEETLARMEALRAAIIGDDARNTLNRRTNFGYLGDWGSLPTAIANLYTAQTPAYAYSTTYGYGAGWRGPYVVPGITAETLGVDAWNHAYVWTPAGTPPTLVSLGSDNAVGGTGTAKDISIQFPSTTWTASAVSGTVLNGSAGLNGRTVELSYPVAGVITTTTTASAADGSFSFSNVPFGVHSIAVTSTPTLPARPIYVDASPYIIPADGLNYRGTNSAPPADLSVTCCRLSLDSTNPVTTTDITAATTLYLVAYRGQNLPLYDGTDWQGTLIGSFLSVTPPATANQVFDVFLYLNSGAPTLETLNWANANTRATALSMQDGVLVKSTDAMRRYLGTARTTATAGQLDDSARRRFVWNVNNRVQRRIVVTDGTATWPYPTSGWRTAHNLTAQPNGNFIELVNGYSDGYLSLQVTGAAALTGGPFLFSVGIGEDAPAANSADNVGAATSTDQTEVKAYLRKYPTVGYHQYYWLENGGGNTTVTWNGGSSYGLVGFIQ